MVKVARDKAKGYVQTWFLAVVIGTAILSAGIAVHVYGALEGNATCREVMEAEDGELHNMTGEWLVVKGQLVDKNEMAFNFMMSFNYKAFIIRDHTGNLPYPVTDYEYEKFKIGEFVKAKFHWNYQSGNYDYIGTERAVQPWLPWSLYLLGAVCAAAGLAYHFLFDLERYRIKLEKRRIAVYEKKENQDIATDDLILGIWS